MCRCVVHLYIYCQSHKYIANTHLKFKFHNSSTANHNIHSYTSFFISVRNCVSRAYSSGALYNWAVDNGLHAWHMDSYCTVHMPLHVTYARWHQLAIGCRWTCWCLMAPRMTRLCLRSTWPCTRESGVIRSALSPALSWWKFHIMQNMHKPILNEMSLSWLTAVFLLQQQTTRALTSPLSCGQQDIRCTCYSQALAWWQPVPTWRHDQRVTAVPGWLCWGFLAFIFWVLPEPYIGKSCYQNMSISAMPVKPYGCILSQHFSLRLLVQLVELVRLACQEELSESVMKSLYGSDFPDVQPHSNWQPNYRRNKSHAIWLAAPALIYSGYRR